MVTGEGPIPVRPTVDTDFPALQGALDATALCPSEMLPDMVAGFLAGATVPEIWLTCEVARRAS